MLAGTYPSGVSVSYTDTTTNNYTSANSTVALAVSAAATTTTLTTPKVNTTFSSKAPQMVTLNATVASSTGGTVNEGKVTFTVGTTLTATGAVSGGQATAILTLPAGFAAGSYPITASYVDSTNSNGVVNYQSSTAAMSGTLTVVNTTTGTGTTTHTTTPVGSLNVFALGIGPTGIDLFEVDSQGDVFAQGLFGGGLVLVNTSLHLPLAVLSNEGLLALLAGSNGQNYLIDALNPFVPFVESAVVAALHM